jgi:tyrosine-specific transport protein
MVITIMNKKIGAIMLIAGTCIGSGMIALPILLAKLGIIPSILLMLSMWLIVYYTSLVNVELNLQAGTGLSLGALGLQFSGKIADFIGTGSFKLLSYALLSVYIYGGTSVLQKMLEANSYQEYTFNYLASLYAITAIALLLLPIKFLDYVNRFLFIGLLAVVLVMIIGLLSTIHWDHLPLFADNYTDLSIWRMIIPVSFTAFGFQVIFHTLTNYCNKDVKLLKLAFFWGSLIPSLVYILWTSSILSAVYQDNPVFYQTMIKGKVEIGELIQELSNIAKWSFVQLLVWWISSLAIITSVLGVGMGLKDSIHNMLPAKSNKFISVSLTIIPAYIVTILIPNAFISVLGFAGMILVIIAILLPIYLFYKAKIINLNYTELKHNWLVILSLVIGIIIMMCEILNMLMRS